MYGTDFTRRYFREWAEMQLQDEALIVPSAREVEPLTTVQAFEEPNSFDVTHLVAAQAAQSPALTDNLERFTESETSARERLQVIREVYGDLRGALEKHKDVVSLILNARTGPAHELDNKIASYLLLGEAPTRLGEKITLPGKNVADGTLLALLGLMRIVGEHELDEAFGLPWLADDDSAEAKRFKTWEIKAGAAGEAAGGALGRAVAVAAGGLINAFLKLPDELSIGVSHIAGIVARKGAERQMHRFLEQNPEVR